jgi:hypothetical protein
LDENEFEQLTKTVFGDVAARVYLLYFVVSQVEIPVDVFGSHVKVAADEEPQQRGYDY